MKKIFLAFLVTVFTASSCTVLEQVSQVQTLSKCDFELHSANQFEIAGITMDDKKDWSDFTFQETLRLTMMLTKNEIPASIRVNLKATNPNGSVAGMNKLEWKMLIDEQEMTGGLLNESFTIPANGGTTMIPVDVSFDLRKMFSGESSKALMNLIANLTGSGGQTSNLAMKLSPSIRVGDRLLQYPGYITVRHQVGK
ncbi:MAG TPA: LEA type 2 family protein [Bacteroidales bacterium]|nr:LEA type 2 family protein [Bacteroidales bacterium]